MDMPFRVGAWQVKPQLDRISGPAGDVHLQPKAMHLLSCLARHAPDVVTKEQIFREVWEGAFVTDEALTFVIWELRKALGDDAKRPRFIETVPKKGYRFIGSPCFEEEARSNEGDVRDLRPPVDRQPGWGFVAAALGLVLGVGLTTWFWTREGRFHTTRFRDRDWVLVQRFENRTGEGLFDGSLEFALEQELAKSAFVNVVSRERIGDTLRLMRRPLETEIDAALAREIALRDGAIRALLAGRVEKRAGRYVVSVRVVDPSSGAIVSSLSAGATTQEGVLQSFRGLSAGLRRVLGEEPLAALQEQTRLQRATTPSLRALQHFSQAIVFVDQDKWSPAAELLERAVDEDPEFATAHIYLAHSRSNLGVPGAGPHYERAFALADGLPDRERYFILGSYYSRHLGDDEKAVQAFEILTSLYPDDYWGVHKLANAYDRLGRHREAAVYRVRAAELRPQSFSLNFGAAQYLLMHGGGRVTETPCFQRARALATAETAREAPEEVADLELLPAHDRWNEGDLPQTLKEVERMARSMESHGGAVQRYLVEDVGRAYLSLGMIQAAETRFRAVADEDRRRYFLAQIALARGDARSFGRYLSGVDIASHIRTHWMDASVLLLSGGTGLLSQARAERVARVLEDMQQDSLPDVLRERVREFSTAARGEQALARGRMEEAVRLLEQGVERLRPRARPVYFLAVESLADAWERRGNRKRALQVLEAATQPRAEAFWDGLFSMRVQLRLAELHRKMGHLERAQAIETELRHLLVYADPDHVVLKQVEELARMPDRRVAAASSPPQG